MGKFIYLSAVNLLATLFLLIGCSSTERTNERIFTQIPDDWAQKYIHPLSADHTDLSDLHFLQALIGDRRIVALGEQTHFDGATFDIRSRIVQYLISEMGFDVVLFENGMFDMQLASDRFAESLDIEDIRANLYTFWKVQEHENMFRHWQEVTDSGKKLGFGGFDIKHTSEGYTANSYSRSMRETMQRVNPEAVKSDAFSEYIAIWEDIERRADRSGFRGALGKLRYKMNNRKKKEFAQLSNDVAGMFEEADELWWAHTVNMLDQGILAYSNVRLWRLLLNRSSFIPVNNRRDVLMAENLAWQLENKYPDRKVILIGATYHFIRNNRHLEPIKVQGIPLHEAVVMGEVLRKGMDEEVFTIGFSAYEGAHGIIRLGEEGTEVVPPHEFSIEHEVVRLWHEQAFLVLRDSEPSPGFWEKGPVIRLFDYESDTRSKKWNQILDAVVVIREMYPARGYQIVSSSIDADQNQEQ
ncbi:MAG: erythromycin esterase family protein [Balneolales bacterium]|nr:erythromycin esterase family protein [Balneolales bacterium]